MSKTVIITSYIPNAEIELGFVDALKQICDHRDAELIITECAANYRPDLESPYQQALQEELAPYLVKGDVRLNANLHISKFKHQINVIDPLSGMESQAAKLGNLILAYPRHRFKTIPRMLRESHTPRALWCTGTISKPYYKETKTGIRMKEYHVVGALIVEIDDDKKFTIRQLQWDGKGFFDLNFYYNSSGCLNLSGEAVDSISMGDDHAIFNNPIIVDKTIELLKLLKPKRVFHHDTLDCASISHHVEGKHITKALINMTLESETSLTVKYLEKMINSTNAQHFLVASNHPEHLDRYLDEGRYLKDPFNHILGLELALRQAKHGDAMDWLLKGFGKKFGKLPRFKTLKRKESFKVKGIEMADHGDEGSNGSRGSTKEKGIVYDGNSITGHTHSPEIGVYGNFVNGTMTYLSLGYTKDSGSSSWLNTHTLVYANGKRTHIHIIP